MDYTTLGHTDIKISRICLGTMTWGLQNNEAEGHEQMDYALDQGVTFWDTAEMYAIPPSEKTYGTTETIMGTWFQKTGRRKDVVLASKISPVPWAVGGGAINKAGIAKSVDASLARLQTDYIDLYQLHWPVNRPNYHFHNSWGFCPNPKMLDREAVIANQIEILEALEKEIQAGKIRAIGLSDDSAWGIASYCALAEKHGLPKMASIQNEYNVLRRRDETDVAEACVLEDVAYLPWSPLAMGVLSGKYLGGQFPEGARFSISESKNDRYEYRLNDAVMAATQKYVDLAAQHDLDPCQMAIAWTLQRPFVASTIIGATNMDQLEVDIAAADVRLSGEVMKSIDAIYKEFPMPF